MPLISVDNKCLVYFRLGGCPGLDPVRFNSNRRYLLLIGFWCLLMGLNFFNPYASCSQTDWFKYPGNPVFQPGKRGEWDEAKIAQTVLYDNGRYNMWYKGWSDVLPGFVGVGYASSPDGIMWKKYEANPLDFICSGDSWDTVFLSFEVIKKDTVYQMWYSGLDKETNTRSIGFAWSEDGLHWTKHHEPVLVPGNDGEWDAAGIGGASVNFDGVHYRMWYNGIDSVSWRGKVGYATSEDGFHWKKHPSNPVLDVGGTGTWDEHGVSVYSVNFSGSFYEMWYDGYDRINTQTGYATSVDGVKWIKSPDNPVLPVGKLGYWDTWIARIPAVLKQDSVYKMWYYGHDYSRGNIGYATTSVLETKTWDTATINKPQTKVKVDLLNRVEYINVDSLLEILPGLQGIDLADACNKLALAYSLNDHKKSLEYAEKALEISDKEDYPGGRAMALYSIGNSRYIMDDYSEALASQLSALWLFDSLGMLFEQGNLLAQIAGIHSYAGSYDLACRYYQQSLDIFKQLNDTGFIVNSLMFLGYAYLSAGDTASAMKQFRSGLAKTNTIQDKWIRGWCFESIGLCYSGHILDSALFYFHKAYKIYNTAWPGKLNLLRTAEAYFAAGPEYYKEAEKHFNQLFPLMANNKYQKVRLYLDAAELYFQTGRYDMTKESLDISLDECQRLLNRQDFTMFASLEEKLEVEIDLKRYMEKIYRLKYRIDTALHNKDSAFTHFILATQWKDSLTNQQNRRQWAMLQGQYEKEKVQNQIAFLEKDAEVRNLTIRKSRIYLLSLGTLVLVVLFGAFILIRQRKIKDQHALEIERLKSEKLKDLDRLKSGFFANISHEFRTPLTLILGPLEKMLANSTDETEEKELKMAIKNALHLQHLISNLLSISKLESGNMQLHASETDIVSLTRGYLQSYESLARQRKISLQFHTEEKEILVFVDREKIEQVLGNLLSNAFKFTDAGGTITVSVSFDSSPVKEEQKGVKIMVSDNGRGIPPEHVDHIFDRFYQVRQPDISFQEGTGIGLTLSKELVELHHGTIEAMSEPGKGSAFTLFLPMGNEHLERDEMVEVMDTAGDSIYFSEAIAYPGTEAVFDAEENSKDLVSQSILMIVEDNADMRAYIRGFFENEFHIVEAVDGLDGYEKSIEHIPDIIISDVMMPGLDGAELVRKMKTDERTSHIPVILLTARASKEDRIESLESGADDFITKPFDAEELKVRVNNLIRQRKMLQEYYRKDFNNAGHALTMEQKFLQKATKTVEKNLSNSDYTIEAFASDMALSRTQLHRKLRALVNNSCSVFIRTIRLKHAAELLKVNTSSISEVAYDTGFNNPAYFSAAFKEHFGMAPSEYQKESSRLHGPS